MNLKQMLRCTDRDTILLHLHTEYHASDGKKYVDEAYGEVLDKLMDMKPTVDKNEPLTAIIVGYRKKYTDVSGLVAGGDERFAIELTPWSEWLTPRIDKPAHMSNELCVAHILHEMTFCGFSEEEISEKLDEIEDSVEETKKELGIEIEKSE